MRTWWSMHDWLCAVQVSRHQIILTSATSVCVLSLSSVVWVVWPQYPKIVLLNGYFLHPIESRSIPWVSSFSSVGGWDKGNSNSYNKTCFINGYLPIIISILGLIFEGCQWYLNNYRNGFPKMFWLLELFQYQSRIKSGITFDKFRKKLRSVGMAGSFERRFHHSETLARSCKKYSFEISFAKVALLIQLLHSGSLKTLLL